MKTDDLIKALAADAKSVAPPIARTLAIALAAGTALSVAWFLWKLGMRGNFADSMMHSWRFAYKFVVTLGIAVPAFFLIRNLTRPDFEPGQRLWWLGLGPALIAIGILLEMASFPADAWRAQMMGHNSVFWLIVIPLLSLAPFAGLLYALKAGAPANPPIAGAVAGLLSAGIAATLYASHCPDDSPMFVAAWYSVGFVLMTGLGAAIGSRFLRW